MIQYRATHDEAAYAITRLAEDLDRDISLAGDDLDVYLAATASPAPAPKKAEETAAVSTMEWCIYDSMALCCAFCCCFFIARRGKKIVESQDEEIYE